MKHQYRIIGSAIALVMVTGSAATAQVNCGDVITGKAVMTTSLVCGADDPALTIDGGSLDMNGERISGCLGDGILLTGSSAKVSNGTVQNCLNGFLIQGDGGHKLTRVMARNNSALGFAGMSKASFVEAYAIDNTLSGFADGALTKSSFTSSVARGNGEDGFRVSGAPKFKDCTATGNGGDGFRFFAEGNAKGLVADNNSGVGIRTTGGAVKIKDSTAIGNTLSGFDLSVDFKGTSLRAVNNGEAGLRVSSRAKISKVSATGNGTDGVVVLGSDAKLSKLAVASNGGDGIRIENSDVSVSRCSVVDSGGNGIENVSGVGVAVSGSTVLESGGTDMVEGVSSCLGNTWKKNVFGTSNLGCIE